MVPSVVDKSASPLRIAAIGGPTASGKTALAVALAGRGMPIEIVNFDALQVYRGVDAATAKPTPTELAAAPFHLLDCADPAEAMTAGQWAALAEPVIAAIHARGSWPLLVGGTGLYLRALVRGLAPIPPVPPDVRVAVEADYQRLGPAAVHAELAAADPSYAARTPAANRQRVTRALEVFRATGRSFSDWHAEHQAQPDRFACQLAVLQPDRAWLHQRIDARAAPMVALLLNEVEELLAQGLSPQAPALQALGYRDAVDVVQGRLAAHELADRLAKAHREYAKRQQTWFAAEPAQLRVDPADPAHVDAVAAALHAWFDDSAP